MNKSMEHKNSLILGFGYTGFYLQDYLAKQNKEEKIVSTSRSDQNHVLFDLEDPATWDLIPQVEKTYWTFPAAPLDLVKSFYHEKSKALGQIVVIGTTSSFLIEDQSEEVSENTARDLNIERVKGEEFLRSKGAILVVSSGIYGPSRNPLDWVKKNYIGRSQKRTNMIHVEDLCQFLVQAIHIGKSGKLYIASDNNSLVWNDVIDLWESRKLIKETPFKESTRVSKIINSSRSIKELNVNLKFPNFSDLNF